MTGFRVGYGIANKEIITKMAKFQAMALTSVAEPMQYSALAALKVNDSSIQNRKRMKKRLDLICNRIREMSLQFVEPDGAMYVYPKLKKGVDDDISLVERLLDLGVALAPGSGFGQAYREFIRISACQSTNLLQKGLDTLALAIS
jgi:aspartate aminotransferase